MDSLTPGPAPVQQGEDQILDLPCIPQHGRFGAISNALASELQEEAARIPASLPSPQQQRESENESGVSYLETFPERFRTDS